MRDILKTYQSIDLGDMDNVKLMNRIDTKYILYADLLPLILEQIKDNYLVLQIGTERLFPYRSLYYDTDQDHMYLAHHNGKLNRYKIRFREYVHSGDCFLEIKHKLKGVRTVKKRMEVKQIETLLSKDSSKFIAKHTPFEDMILLPRVHTDFSRITLVSKAMNERVTIDMGLNFKHNGTAREVDKLAIIELKREGRASHSKLIDALNHFGINAKGFSKYCIGRALLDKDLKSNNFKQRILTLNKITDGNFYYRNYS